MHFEALIHWYLQITWFFTWHSPNLDQLRACSSKAGWQLNVRSVPLINYGLGFFSSHKSIIPGQSTGTGKAALKEGFGDKWFERFPQRSFISLILHAFIAGLESVSIHSTFYLFSLSYFSTQFRLSPLLLPSTNMTSNSKAIKRMLIVRLRCVNKEAIFEHYDWAQN